MTERRLLRRAAACALAALAIAAAPPAGASNDQYFTQQWNLAQIGAEEAWGTSTGSGVLVGIVDTGIDSSHPDLRGNVAAQANCVGGTCREGTAPDGHGHGTAVAGVIAATANNGTGIAGVAPDARLVVAKAMDDRGRGRTEDINAAIQWVVERGAKVVNLSLGDPDLTIVARLGSPLESGIEYAWSRGAIPVLASGNYREGLNETGSANYGNLNAVVVGAVDKGGNVASYSTSLGTAKWGVVAPGGSGRGTGVDVVTTAPSGRYRWIAGTSFAAPHVSGALALLLAQGYQPTAAVQRLLGTVDSSVSCGEGCKGTLRLASAVAPTTTVVVAAAAGDPGLGAASGGMSPVVWIAVTLAVAVLAGGAAFAAARRRRTSVTW